MKRETVFLHEAIVYASVNDRENQLSDCFFQVLHNGIHSGQTREDSQLHLQQDSVTLNI